MSEMFGGLLDFDNQEKLRGFLEKTDKEMAVKVIDLAITHCQQSGIFSLEESYVLYIMLIKLKE